MTILLCY